MTSRLVRLRVATGHTVTHRDPNARGPLHTGYRELMPRETFLARPSVAARLLELGAATKTRWPR